MQPLVGLGFVVEAVLKSGGSEKCSCALLKPEIR